MRQKSVGSPSPPIKFHILITKKFKTQRGVKRREREEKGERERERESFSIEVCFVVK